MKTGERIKLQSANLRKTLSGIIAGWRNGAGGGAYGRWVSGTMLRDMTHAGNTGEKIATGRPQGGVNLVRERSGNGKCGT
jgi:hypothetical protein